jgi:hypothetical protein
MEDWLKKAKEEFDHIESSEYGQLSDGQIRLKEHLRAWSKLANEKARKVVTDAKTTAQKTNGKKNKGRKHSKEIRIKISESTKGKPKTKEHSEKISNSLKGKAKSEEHKQKLSQSRIGIKCEHTSKRNSEMNSMKFKCEHCKREIGGLANYKRFHGDKCKSKPQNS